MDQSQRAREKEIGTIPAKAIIDSAFSGKIEVGKIKILRPKKSKENTEYV